MYSLTHDLRVARPGAACPRVARRGSAGRIECRVIREVMVERPAAPALGYTAR